MSLEQIADNSRTDKNTLHSYLPLYEKLLNKKKDTATNVLEVGICLGGSIKMWHDYFKNATVYGLDIMSIDDVYGGIKNKERITLHTSSDAYNKQFFDANFLSKNIKFDLVLDDGPHTLQSMIQFIQLYSQLLADDGILIIEDVQSCVVVYKRIYILNINGYNSSEDFSYWRLWIYRVEFYQLY